MTLAFAAAAVVGANAQFLIGGNVGFEYDKTENVTITEDKTIGFEIAPKLGYQLNENMSVGAYVGFLALATLRTIGRTRLLALPPRVTPRRPNSTSLLSSVTTA